MTHTLIIRGFNDQVHEQLGEIANQRGVSINSIVKDAVDICLKKNESEVPRKHQLIIYSDDESIRIFLISLVWLDKEGNFFSCFFGLSHYPSIELLSNLKWYYGTSEPYYHSSPTRQKSVEKEKLQIQPTAQVQKHKN